MYFDFSKEQYMARDSAREFLAERMSTGRLRELLGTDTGFDGDVWRRLAELGWTSVLVPEEHGGLGLGFLDLALLLEESGRALLPAPIVETAVVLPLMLAAGSPAQRQRWLPGLASGSVVATLALAGHTGLPVPAGIGLRAKPAGHDWRLEGEALLVPFGESADVILAVARTGRGDGVGLFLLEPGDPGLAWEPLVGLDPSLRTSVLRLERVRLGPDRWIGEPGHGRATLDRVLPAACTALALQAVGGAGRALAMAVEYARVRHQFGQPIGSFQAVKHTCADMLVAHETTRSGAYYAAWSVGTAAPDAAVAAAMAKATCSEMFRFVAGAAIQVHGGIGFTWEHDLHFFLKRAKYLEFVLGTPDQHRDAIAAACFPGRSNR